MVPTIPHTHGAQMTPPPSTPGGTPGEVLRARRVEIGKRQDDLANDAEVSQKLISEIERGEQSLLAVGIGRARNIARALRWSLNDLQAATGLDLGVEAQQSAQANAPGDLSNFLANPPVVPGGRFVPSAPLSQYGSPKSLTFIPDEINRPGIQVVILDNPTMKAGGMAYGATLYIDTAERAPEKGRVYLVKNNGKHEIRRAAVHGGDVWLYLDSPEHGGPPAQLNELSVLGRVFKFLNPPSDT